MIPCHDPETDVFPCSIKAIGGQVVFSFDPLVKLAVDVKARSIFLFDCADQTTDADIEHFLFDHIAPRIIAGLDHLVLHGAAVAVDNAIAVFLGQTGAGKSTLSASLDQKGHRLLGDDAVVVTECHGHFFGEAVYPSLRLYPESIAKVLGSGANTAIMAHYSDKLHVKDFFSPMATENRLPLGCVFTLALTDQAPSFRLLTPRESVMAIIKQSFALDPDEIKAAATRMAKTTQLANAVSVYELNYPHDFAALPDVIKIVEDCIAVAGFDTFNTSLDEGTVD